MKLGKLLVFSWFAFWVLFFVWVCQLDAQVNRVSNRNQSLTVYAGPAQTITLPATAALSGTITPKPGTLRTTAQWQSSGSAAVSFSNPTGAITTATFSTAGIYVLSLTGKTAKLSATSRVTVTVNGPTIPPAKANNLAWDPVIATATAPVDGYNLYRTDGGCDDLSTFQKANSQLITSPTYSDPPGTAGAWCYFVRAVNSAGEGPASNVIWIPTKQ